MAAAPSSVDAYLAGLPADQRRVLEALRAVIREAAPGAAEGISYGMPGYKYRGKPLVYFGAARSHVALYGNNVRFLSAAQREGLDCSKGTIRFTPEAPLAPELVRHVVACRMAEIDGA